jgi:hypothetical protein
MFLACGNIHVRKKREQENAEGKMPRGAVRATRVYSKASMRPRATLGSPGEFTALWCRLCIIDHPCFAHLRCRSRGAWVKFDYEHVSRLLQGFAGQLLADWSPFCA